MKLSYLLVILIALLGYNVFLIQRDDQLLKNYTQQEQLEEQMK